MIQDFFCKYYDYRPFKNQTLNKILGNSSKILAIFANIFLPFYYRLFPGVEYYRRNYLRLPKTDAIICFTSFPARIGNVWLVIETLLRQRVLPQKVVLYISKLQFADKNSIPSVLNQYVELGVLSIKLVDGDIRSHKKYWYAVSEYPESPIITIDDDIIYHSSFIDGLERAAAAHKNTIPCYYWTFMARDINNKVLPYSKWTNKRSQFEESGISSDVFFGSGGGAYFPVGSLTGADLSYDTLEKVCPLADDIWLNAIVRKNSYFPYGLPYTYSVPEWYCRRNQTLHSVNNGACKNDEQLLAVIDYFEKENGFDPFYKKNENK